MRRKRSSANDQIPIGQLRTSGSFRLKVEAKPEVEEKSPPAQLAPLRDPRAAPTWGIPTAACIV